MCRALHGLFPSNIKLGNGGVNKISLHQNSIPETTGQSAVFLFTPHPHDGRSRNSTSSSGDIVVWWSENNSSSSGESTKLNELLPMIRIWRSLLQTKSNPFLLKTPSFNPFTPLLLMQHSLNAQTKMFSSAQNLLSPQVVHSTLLNCPSDVVSLSFFLWCAKQPNYFHDRLAFNHMVIVVTRLTEQFETVRGIVMELQSIGCVIKPQLFLILLRIYWCGGMHDLVFKVFEEMCSYGYTPNTFARNVVIDVLFKIGSVDMALRVLRETQVPNFLTFNIALCNLCKLNDLLNVQETLKIMLREGYYPNLDTFELVLSCFCKVGRTVEAFQVLGLMITLGMRVTVAVWSMLVDGFCKSGRLDITSELFRKMVETGCFPNVVTYTSLIKGFMESQNVDSAFTILRIMEFEGCALDLVLCNVLISCLSKLGRYDDALDIFLGLPNRKLEPDCFTVSSMLSVICMSKKFFLLPKLISGHVIQADVVVCNSLLSYFCKAGFPSHALNFYSDMVERDFRPDQYTFVGLLVALCKAGRVEEAINVYHGIVMNYTGLDAHIHTAIIDGLIKVGKVHTAIRLFRKAVRENYPLDVVSYTSAIIGLLKGDRAEEACTLYSQMKDVGVNPNAQTYNTMLDCFCKKRDANLVREMLRDMIDAEIELNFSTFTRVTKFLYKSHSSHSVFDLLIQMSDSGLMPDKALSLLLLDRLPPGAKLGNAHPAFSQGFSNVNIAVDASSSDDLACAAASVG